MPVLSWGHSQYWAGSAEPPPPPPSEELAAHPKTNLIDEMRKEPYFWDAFAWKPRRGRPPKRKVDPNSAIDAEVRTAHLEELQTRDLQNVEGLAFREKMKLAQRLSQLSQLGENKQVETILEQAERDGWKVRVVRPPIDLDKLKEQWREEDVKEQVRKRKKALEQKIEDEVKLRNKIKMARVRSKRKK